MATKAQAIKKLMSWSNDIILLSHTEEADIPAEEFNVEYDFTGDTENYEARIYLPTKQNSLDPTEGYEYEFLEPLIDLCKNKGIPFKIGTDDRGNLHINVWVEVPEN